MDGRPDRASESAGCRRRIRLTEALASEPPLAVLPLHRRLSGGAVAGMAGGLAMYAVLAGVALSQGRGPSYPFAAVHALLSGKRVLPVHPRPDRAVGQLLDLSIGPMYFFLPAVCLGVVVAIRIRRLGAGDGRRDWAVAAARTAAVASALMFVAAILAVAGTEVARIQRFSSGNRIRQLGLPAWLLAHATYVGVVAATIRPLTVRPPRSDRPHNLPSSASEARSGV